MTVPSYRVSAFPLPPSSRTKQPTVASDETEIWDPRCSLTSSLESFQSKRTSAATDLQNFTALNDSQLVLEYVMCQLEAEKKKRDYDVGLLGNQLQREKTTRESDNALLRKQVQEIVSALTAASKRERDQVSTVDALLKAQASKMEELQKRAFDAEASLKTLQDQMVHLTRTPHSDRQIADVLPLNGHLQQIWKVQCIFVLNAAKPNTAEADGVAYLKLQHGRSLQRISISDDSHTSFVTAVEERFATILHGRPWMPLAAHRVSNGGHNRVTLDRMTSKQRSADWSRQFLDDNCLVLDAKGRVHVYIALQNETLSLAELQRLGSTGVLPDKRARSDTESTAATNTIDTIVNDLPRSESSAGAHPNTHSKEPSSVSETFVDALDASADDSTPPNIALNRSHSTHLRTQQASHNLSDEPLFNPTSINMDKAPTIDTILAGDRPLPGLTALPIPTTPSRSSSCLPTHSRSSSSQETSYPRQPSALRNWVHKARYRRPSSEVSRDTSSRLSMDVDTMDFASKKRAPSAEPRAGRVPWKGRSGSRARSSSVARSFHSVKVPDEADLRSRLDGVKSKKGAGDLWCVEGGGAEKEPAMMGVPNEDGSKGGSWWGAIMRWG